MASMAHENYNGSFPTRIWSAQLGGGASKPHGPIGQRLRQKARRLATCLLRDQESHRSMPPLTPCSIAVFHPLVPVDTPDTKSPLASSQSPDRFMVISR